MNVWSGKRLLITLIACGASVGLAMLLCVAVGSNGAGWPGAGIREFREESVLSSARIGAALASAGVAYQAVLRNPLADPYLLGVSSGASLAAYVWQLPAFAGMFALFSHEAFAFAGALAAVSVVLGLAGRRGRIDPVTLLLVGVIVNAVNGSVFLLLNAVIKDLPASG